MTTKSQLFYWAACDAPGCEVETRLDDNTVYDEEPKLDREFEQRSYIEGNLQDDYGWLKVGDAHYCGNHTSWDEDADTRVADPDGGIRAAQAAAWAAERAARNTAGTASAPTLPEILDAHA